MYKLCNYLKYGLNGYQIIVHANEEKGVIELYTKIIAILRSGILNIHGTLSTILRWFNPADMYVCTMDMLKSLIISVYSAEPLQREVVVFGDKAALDAARHSTIV